MGEQVVATQSSLLGSLTSLCAPLRKNKTEVCLKDNSTPKPSDLQKELRCSEEKIGIEVWKGLFWLELFFWWCSARNANIWKIILIAVLTQKFWQVGFSSYSPLVTLCQLFSHWIKGRGHTINTQTIIVNLSWVLLKYISVIQNFVSQDSVFNTVNFEKIPNLLTKQAFLQWVL